MLEKKTKKYSIINDIIKPHWKEYQVLNPKLHSRISDAVSYMSACRTAEMGENVYTCVECGDLKTVYHSCKHRFCPQCGQADTNKWAKKIIKSLLNTKHHHVIFTVPHELHNLFRLNEKLLYGALMSSCAKSLQEWFRESKQTLPGIMAVLHTFGSNLMYHVHVHVLVSSGGLSLNYKDIKPLDQNYLVNADWLKNKFRHIFEGYLIEYEAADKLKYPRNIEKGQIKKFIKRLNRKGRWVALICKRAIQGTEEIVNYIGRYTRRACISEYRIEEVTENEVSFSHKDYKSSNNNGHVSSKIARIPTINFMTRLFQHIPHKGFRIVRYYGIYNNSVIGLIPAEYRASSQSNTQPEKEEQQMININRGCTSYLEYLQITNQRKKYICEVCNREYVLISCTYHNPLKKFRSIGPSNDFPYLDTG